MITNHPPPAAQPLAGLRVLDCATIIAAPFTAMLLADWGADVIKIEHPAGDGLRTNGPAKDGVGLNYAYYNRNKRNLVLDLSTADGQELLRGLAAKSDVLIENFRPGVMERWGLGWETLHALNPKLVMLRMTGFGQFGPHATRAGFGTLAEALSGFAHINGYPDGPPTLPPFGLADGVAGVGAAYAVMLALYHRDRQDAPGQMIDMAIIEPILHLLGGQITQFDQLGLIQGRSGNSTSANAPRNVYRTREGRWVSVSASARNIAERVMRLVGRPDLIGEPWFGTGPGRGAHRELIDQVLGDWIGARELPEVMAAFEAAGAAAAPIQDVAQVCADPQYQALGSITSVTDPTLGPLRMQNLMFRMSATPGAVRHPGPRLGEHRDAILEELLGLGPERLAQLRAAGVTAARVKPGELG